MNYNRVVALGGCIGGNTSYVPVIKSGVGNAYYVYTVLSKPGTHNRMSYYHRHLKDFTIKLVIDLPLARVDELGFARYERILEGAAYHSGDRNWAVFKISSP